MSMCQKLAASILFLFCGISIAFSQGSYTAQIRGTVTDPSGAILRDAVITITNDATGIATVAHSNGEGLYILTGLRPASYTLKAEATGFRVIERKNVVLAVSQDTTVNFSMNPLSVTETVVVTGARPLLDTESAALGTDVTNEYLRDIPLYNRSLFGLVFTAGGVTETSGSGISDNYPSGTNFVSNGQRNATAEIRLDGSPLSAPEQGEGGNSNVYYTPSVEVLQEFKVQNNSFAAEYGNNGGTIVNMVFRQGGNKFHGAGWWYGQRSEFDSRDFFNNGPKPDHVRDQYGFSVSGPIVKNRTFFLFDYEKRRTNDPQNEEGFVPTDLMRQGDFRELLALDSPIQIFNPRNITCDDNGCTRAQFTTPNVIDEIDPIGQAIINLYPEPNVDGAIFPDANFRTVILTSFPEWQFDVKLDHQINTNHKVSGRYSRYSGVYTAPTVIGFGDTNDGVIYKTDVHNVGMEYNWAIKPTVLFSSRLSLDRVVAPGKSNNYPTLESVGFPAILAGNGLHRMPTIAFAGGDSTGEGGSLSLFSQCCVDTNFAHTLWTYSSALQWVVGRHSFKFGGEQRVFLNSFWQPNNPTGIFDIQRDVTTSQPNAGLGDSGEGFSFATLLTGFAYSGQLNILPAVADKSQETAFFVQDDWKVTPRLTLNLGLRYEWSNPYTERFNRSQFSDFNGDTGINIPGLGDIKGTTLFAGGGRRSAPVDRNNFAPRFGFAYQLGSNTVLRGGAGVFYGMNVATNFQYAGTAFRKGAQINFTKDNFQSQYASFDNPFPAGLAPVQGTKYGALAEWGFDNSNDLGTEKARNAEIYQWNLGVQHLFPGNIVIGVDYSANRSTHLPWAGANNSTRNRNFLSTAARNQAIADAKEAGQSPSDYLNTIVDNPFRCMFTTVDAQGNACAAPPVFDELDSVYNDAQIPRLNLLRPYPQFDGAFTGLPLLGASSAYHSLQVRFQKRTTHNLSFEGNYTLSKATDDSSAGANAWIGNLQFDNPQVLDNLKVEHGISSNDATHRLTVAVIYGLPFGHGRWIGGGMNRVADAIVGGWSLDTIVTLQSGQPIAVFMANPQLADGNQRPNVTCSNLRTGISFYRAAATGLPYLNQDCFDDPGDQVPGNAPRHFSNLRGPGVRNLDLSLSKEFEIRENMKLQIRAEMYNVTNTPRFAFPDSGWARDSGFGTVQNTTNNFRRMQFGARFQF
jgi:hypothetical protein